MVDQPTDSPHTRPYLPRRGARCDAPKPAGSMPTLPILERAYELARSGQCQGVEDIRNRLKAEGYGGEIQMQMSGRTLRADLRRLCRQAWKPVGAD
jgi:hypothetical protein